MALLQAPHLRVDEPYEQGAQPDVDEDLEIYIQCPLGVYFITVWILGKYFRDPTPCGSRVSS